MGEDITENYHGGNPQSVAAGLAVKKQTQKRMILTQLQFLDLTCKQLEWRTGISHQSCSSRLTGMLADGTIVRTGKIREGSAVYRLRAEGEPFDKPQKKQVALKALEDRIQDLEYRVDQLENADNPKLF